MSLSAGAKLGPYEVVGPLGAGGMGEVYRERDTRLERAVARLTVPPQAGLLHDEWGYKYTLVLGVAGLRSRSRDGARRHSTRWPDIP
jgi:hypothetical protein